MCHLQIGAPCFSDSAGPLIKVQHRKCPITSVHFRTYSVKCPYVPSSDHDLVVGPLSVFSYPGQCLQNMVWEKGGLKLGAEQNN